MIEKRFYLMKKFLRKDKFHDTICHRFMDSKQTEKALNRLYAKYSLLKIENEQLKSTNMEMEDYLGRLEEENKDKPFFKIVDDYLIEYDGNYFDLHRPSHIRSLIYIINRANGYSELQCEYNDGDSE